jgi:hypothetical protein
MIMKVLNRTDEHREDKTSACLLPSSTGAETVAFAMLGFLGTSAIVIALISASMPPASRTDPMSDAVNYVRSGQVIADVRTAAAMANYLLDHGPSVATNALGSRSTAKNNPFVLTNSTTGEPKV